MIIAIVDDDISIANSLKLKIHKILPKAIIYVVSFYDDELLYDNIDLILMDIELWDNKNGIEFYTKIKQYQTNLKVIFMSSFSHHSQDIFEVDPLYFLIKPIQDDKLQRALEKAKNIIDNNDNEVLFESKELKVKIKETEIFYISSDKRKILVHTQNQIYEIYDKLDNIFDTLSDNFCRCHQSYIVNLKHIKLFQKNEFVLTNSIVIPISQKRYKQSKKDFTRFMGESI